MCIPSIDYDKKEEGGSEPKDMFSFFESMG